MVNTALNVRIKEVMFRSNYSRKKYKDEKTVMYFHIEGENIIQNLENRRCRPYNEYRKFIPQALEMLKEQGLEISPDYKFSWNQYAGCSMCPCSPGFIVKGHRGYDIWITITSEEE